MTWTVNLNGVDIDNGDVEGNAYSNQDTGLPAILENVAKHVAFAYRAPSATSLSVGTGTKNLTTHPNKPFTEGLPLRIERASDSAVYMKGRAVSYDPDTGALEFNATDAVGAGTYTDWLVRVDIGGEIDGAVQAAEDARDAAQVAQTGAETAQGLAEDARDAAQVAQTGAETAQGAAEGFRDEAEEFAIDTAGEAAGGSAKSWAQTAEDVDVPGAAGGSRSALHYAAKAAASAATINLPALSAGQQTKVLRPKSDGTGYELQETNSGAGTVVALDGSGALPAVSGANLTGLPTPFVRALVFEESDVWTPAFSGRVRMTVYGAGGSGGVARGKYARATGGAAGGFAQKIVNVTTEDEWTITIGAGGDGIEAAGAGSDATPGNPGGVTSISNGDDITITCNGGAGGGAAQGSAGTTDGAVGGTATGGDINVQGGGSGSATTTTSTDAHAATGGGAVGVNGVGYSSGHAASTGNAAVSGGAGVGGSSSDVSSNERGAGGGSQGPASGTTPGRGLFGVGQISTSRSLSALGFLQANGPILLWGAGGESNTSSSNEAGPGAGSGAVLAGSAIITPGPAGLFAGGGAAVTTMGGAINSGTSGIGTASGGRVTNASTNYSRSGSGGSGLVIVEYI